MNEQTDTSVKLDDVYMYMIFVIQCKKWTYVGIFNSTGNSYNRYFSYASIIKWYLRALSCGDCTKEAHFTWQIIKSIKSV